MAIDQNSPFAKYQGVDYGTAGLMGIQDLLGMLGKLAQKGGNLAVGPLAAGSASLGALSGTQAGQNPLPAMSEAGQKAFKAPLSPYQKGIEAGLKESGKLHATEALSMGVPAEHIEQQAGFSQLNPGQLQNSPYQQGQPGFGSQPSLNQMLIPGGQPQQPQAPQQPMPQAQVPNPLSALQSLGGFIHQQGNFDQQTGQVKMPTFFGMESDFANQRFLDNQLRKQELLGQKPLQAGEREKVGLETDREIAKLKIEQAKTLKERQINFFKEINQPLSSAKDLSLVESALTGIDDMTNLLGIQADESGKVTMANGKLLKNVNWLNKNRQQLQRARDLYINKTLRRDSGAAIGKKEEDDFKRIVGFDIGMKSFMQNPEVIGKALFESKDQLIRDRNRLSPNERQRSLVSGLRERGFKDDEIYDYLSRSGDV